MQHQGTLQPCNLLRLFIHGKYLRPLINPDNTLVQYFHKDVELALQPSGTRKHHIKVIGTGDNIPKILLEPGSLQKFLQAQLQRGFNHGFRRQAPVPDVHHMFHPLRHIALLIRSHCQRHAFHRFSPRVKRNEADVVDAQLVQGSRGFTDHLFRHVDKQRPCAGRNGPQPPYGLPHIGHMYLTNLGINGYVLRNLLPVVKGIRGHHVQVSPFHIGNGPLHHAVRPHLHIFPK